MCSVHVVLPDSSWTGPVPNQGPARMQHQTLLLDAELRKCVCVCLFVCVFVCVRVLVCVGVRLCVSELLKGDT